MTQRKILQTWTDTCWLISRSIKLSIWKNNLLNYSDDVYSDNVVYLPLYAFWMNGSSVNLSPLKWSFSFLPHCYCCFIRIMIYGYSLGSLDSMDWLIWSSCRYLFNFSISFFWIVWKDAAQHAVLYFISSSMLML